MTETTTDAATQDPGVAAFEQATQPDEQPAEAVTTPDSESTPTQTESSPEAAPAESDDITDFLQAKGIDLSTPEGQRKLAQSYREAEKAMHKTRQEASELAKQFKGEPVDVDTDNELLAQLVERDVQRDRAEAVDAFIRETGITPDQDLAMGQWLEANPKKKALVLNGELSLKEAFDLSGVGKSDPTVLKEQGKKEALENLASKQRTTAPTGAAVTQQAPAKEDPFLAGFNSV